jgi:HD-GYP domain-containing protein (c-di-GMP phosphodiesterase class II)
VRATHERYDGAGYLAGAQIPLPARIVFGCDAYHAMTTDRPYAPRMSRCTAHQELRRGAGTQFDPGVADALLTPHAPGAPNRGGHPWPSPHRLPSTRPEPRLLPG